MGTTKTKGDLGVAQVMTDILKRGCKVALPIGEDWPYDLIVLRSNKLERIQCKYTESNGSVIKVKCESSNNWCSYQYTSDQIDWLAVYDKNTDKCYYIHSSELGKGKYSLYLRLTPTKNNRTKNIRNAEDYLSFELVSSR